MRTESVTLIQDCYFETWLDSRQLDYGHASAGEQIDLLGGRYRTKLISARQNEDEATVLLSVDLDNRDTAEVKAAKKRLRDDDYGPLYEGHVLRKIPVGSDLWDDY